MGCIIDGTWTDQDSDDLFAGGEFQRPTSEIRGWITADGTSGYPAEAGRYHLYIMEGCPWAHRTWLLWTLEKLRDVVGLSFLVPRPGAQGWSFDPASEEYRDPLGDRRWLHQVYTASDPTYTGRCTVPVLWDKRSQTIVSNDSADIVEMFDSAFDDHLAAPRSYYPKELRGEIDALNQRINSDLNGGVYSAGFARTPAAYQTNVARVFAMLDELEERLSSRRYLFGDDQTIADWRLFPTLVRFDVAYHSAFGCSTRRLIDYPSLWAYTRDLYQQPGVAETVRLDLYRVGYHSIPFAIGHRAIPPVAPDLDFDAPHGRDQYQLPETRGAWGGGSLGGSSV